MGLAGLGVRGLSARARELRGAAGPDVNQARKRIVELLESPASSSASRPGHAGGEVLREGRAPGGDRDEPAVVHPHDRAPRGADRARPRAAVAPAVHARALRGLGERADRRLVRQPPALLRRAVPALVPDRRQRCPCSTNSRSRRARSSCRSIPRPTSRTAMRPDSGGSRGLRRRPRRDGHVGDLVADAADRGHGPARTRSCSRGCSRWTCARRPTTSSGPGCSPRSCAPAR